jgi:hypothetical protein
MYFEILGDIANVETFAIGSSIQGAGTLTEAVRPGQVEEA